MWETNGGAHLGRSARVVRGQGLKRWSVGRTQGSKLFWVLLGRREGYDGEEPRGQCLTQGNLRLGLWGGVHVRWVGGWYLGGTSAG
jgi:hypothetical protein